MAPTPLARLVVLQNHRNEEIKQIGNRIRERAPATLNRAILQTRIKTVNELWAEARKTHADIALRAESAADPYVAQNQFHAMQRTYEDTLDSLLTALTSVPSDDDRVPRRRGDENDQDERPAKLPRLDLPSFSGRYEDWDSFADIFTTLVHDAPRIADTTKLQYLKSCLKGPAAELVKDVAILGINYASTWKALRDRFYNPRLTINRLLDSLANIAYLKRESAIELRAFVDEVRRIVRALTNLGAPVAHWDMWLVHTMEIRLDPESRKIWESELVARDRQMFSPGSDLETNEASRFPKFVDLAAFLERRAQSLSVIQGDRDDKRATQRTSSNCNSRRVHHAQPSQSVKASKCRICSGDHFIARCPTFVAKTVIDRRDTVRNLKLCFNCLGYHKIRSCQSTYRCRVCREKHHSMLHCTPPGNTRGPTAAEATSSKDDGAPASHIRTYGTQTTVGAGSSVNAYNTSSTRRECSVLLATAQAIVFGPHGNQTRVRALLDQGSEATFVSEALVQLLGLPRDRVRTSVTGIGGCEAGVAKHATCFTMQSYVDSRFKLEINAFVLPRLTSELPSRNLVELNLGQFENLSLADPEFHLSDRVDIIIGADVYGRLLRSGLKTFSTTSLVAQNTALGWVISGPTQRVASRRAVPRNQVSVKALRCAVNDDLSEIIQRFWTVEEVTIATKKLKPADEACEKVFDEKHTRDSEGRFKVRLPLAAEPPIVAVETRKMALGSLRHQHQKFSRNPNLARAYIDFMDTYSRLGHMTRVPKDELYNPRSWYLPHHAVVTSTPQGSKIRVVFDASRKTRDEHCLNDFLMAGPPLQGDLLIILLNWRRYRFAFTADIVKMFRQIRIAREDQDLQRILWSPSPEIPVTDYRLTTVTYGTACAPYLAIRTLLQLARDEKTRFPLGAACLESNTYVDDTFAGADDLPTAVRKRDELVGILKSAGIELDKWAANHSDLLLSRARSNDHGAIKKIDYDNAVKTLGVHWNPSSDSFSFSSSTLDSGQGKLTKRSIYSEIARLFDPLGWLAPITVIAKVIMQDLWIEKCEWDSPPSAEVRERWQNYCQSLSSLPKLTINRWLGLSQNRPFEIHGFSDASSRASAAVVYLRIDDGNDKFRVSLLTAKTKVAPVKTVSIPNLELCGATLLVKLVTHLQKLDFLRNAPIRLWSDSQIVLTWLKKHPCHWKTFVANRVSLIQTELPSAVWAHVPTKQNPADLATRGVTPAELKSTDLWWHGPKWLASQSENWPQPPKTLQALHTRSSTDEPVLLTKFSSLNRLTRVTAWCLRPLLQLRRHKTGHGSFPKSLTTTDLTHARLALVKLAQSHAFSKEIELLKAKGTLPKHNPLRKLTPLICEDGILRVGGRLSNANLPRHVQHPPILPRLSSLSQLYVRYAHRCALHGGPTLTLSILLRFVWIVGMRGLVKTAIHKCVTCQRHKPRLAQQLMGDLPAARVTPARPFTTTGLDYAGPFQVRTSKGRGQRSYKGYIALFVCFATKAIHLEVVSDLTTATFIAAFRRFASRRGLCKQLFSDNATTYRGADAELRARFQAASEFYKEVADVLANDGTSWTFIPPTTPHYGGLWEAGVKSTKNLLKKTIGEHMLTLEELSTVLAEIEACLNSRPLCQLTSDPEDLQALTPSHFLIGTASGVIPDEETPSVPENRLDRFQLLQRIRDTFWKRWSSEYVLQMQERGKWQRPTANFTVGQLVLMKDDRYPTCKWPLGRILELHPGADGFVRVFTVKTPTNTLRRHITGLAPLALEQPKDKEDLARRGDIDV